MILKFLFLPFYVLSEQVSHDLSQALQSKQTLSFEQISSLELK